MPIELTQIQIESLITKREIDFKHDNLENLIIHIKFMNYKFRIEASIKDNKMTLRRLVNTL